jgi:K+-transporting ATPase KdpF subunit
MALMSIESGLLIVAVVALVAYLVAALIFPERF